LGVGGVEGLVELPCDCRGSSPRPPGSDVIMISSSGHSELEEREDGRNAKLECPVSACWEDVVELGEADMRSFCVAVQAGSA
jgi:hypothetical protein